MNAYAGSTRRGGPGARDAQLLETVFDAFLKEPPCGITLTRLGRASRTPTRRLREIYSCPQDLYRRCISHSLFSLLTSLRDFSARPHARPSMIVGDYIEAAATAFQTPTARNLAYVLMRDFPREVWLLEAYRASLIAPAANDLQRMLIRAADPLGITLCVDERTLGDAIAHLHWQLTIPHLLAPFGATTANTASLVAARVRSMIMDSIHAVDAPACAGVRQPRSRESVSPWPQGPSPGMPPRAGPPWSTGRPPSGILVPDGVDARTDRDSPQRRSASA
jgi:hypothetical protein